MCVGGEGGGVGFVLVIGKWGVIDRGREMGGKMIWLDGGVASLKGL